MSIVCNVVSTAGSWLMCDGRAQKDGKIVSENLKKFQMINEYVLVGFTGVLKVAETALERIKTQCDNAVLENIKCDSFASILSALLRKSTIETTDPTVFVVTGKSSSGKLESFVVTQSGEIQSFVPTGIDDLKCIAIGDLPKKSHLSSFLSTSIKENGLSENGIIQGMRDCIFFAAEQKDSINKNITIAKILR